MNDPFFSRFLDCIRTQTGFPFVPGYDLKELVDSNFDCTAGQVSNVREQKTLFSTVAARILHAQGGRGYPARHQRLLKAAADWQEVDPVVYATAVLEAASADYLIGMPKTEEWAKDNVLGKSVSVALTETALCLFTVKDLDWIVEMRCAHHTDSSLEDFVARHFLELMLHGSDRSGVMRWIIPGAHGKRRTTETILELFAQESGALDDNGRKAVTMCLRDSGRDIPDAQMSEMLASIAKPQPQSQAC